MRAIATYAHNAIIARSCSLCLTRRLAVTATTFGILRLAVNVVVWHTLDPIVRCTAGRAKLKVSLVMLALGV